MTTGETFTVHSVDLDLVRITKSRVLSRLEDQLMLNAAVRAWREETTGNLVVELGTLVLGLEGKEASRSVVRKICVPSTLWQHLKESLFDRGLIPRCFVKRWPIRYIHHDVTVIQKVYRICPHGNYKWDARSSTVHLSWLKDGDA
jgi:hypothetical protein